MNRRLSMTLVVLLCIVLAAPGMAARPMEGSLDAFLGGPALDLQRVYEGGRFPNILVTVDGTVLAMWGGVQVRRSEDGGDSWGPKILIGEGFMGGGAIVNETNGDVLAFVEQQHPPAPLTIYRSQDDGKSWSAIEAVVHPDANGNVPSMHMNEAGITLRHGQHAGRLIRAARHYAGRNHRDQWPEHYTTAIYSDDHGANWHTSKPFADRGTGEAALAELADGRLYYNSRAHWYRDASQPPLRRRSAVSADGGATWTDWQIVASLPDGPQDTNYGCMGGLVRLPIKDRDILVYSNCDSPQGRHHGTIWTSFDGGMTWPLKRLLTEDDFAYSSLTAGRPETASEGWIYCNFEDSGSSVARFNLSWLLLGELTGDGTVPPEFVAE